MAICLNIYAGVIIVASAFIAFFITGNSDNAGPESARTTLFYTFAGCLLLFDLALRACFWRFGLHPGGRPASAHRVTRKGIVTEPRITTLALPEALFGRRAGGSFCFIPVWLLGIALALSYQMGWLAALLRTSTPGA